MQFRIIKLLVWPVKKLRFLNKWINFCFDFSGEGSTFLNFQQGDLIILENDITGETVMTSGWCIGYSDRTGERGDFPAETVYVLPTLSKPPPEILVNI